MTSVEKAATQYKFIKRVAQQLNCKNLNLIKGDAFKFIESCSTKFDIIFADPPYDLPNFGEVPTRILGSRMLSPDTIVIVEHSKGLRLLVASRILRPPHLRIGKFSLFRPGDEKS